MYNVPLSRIFLLFIFYFFIFIFSKVLAVLDWELSTLGEDLKYYANFSYADSLICSILYLAIKKKHLIIQLHSS
jgi:hypothetical protein